MSSKWKLRFAKHLFNGLAPVAPRLVGRKAVSIMCSPRKGEFDDCPVDPDIFSYAREFSLVSEINEHIHVFHWEGTGPSILLAHGWESNTARWQWLLPHLRSANFNIFAIDGPAHGKSGSDHFSILKYASWMDTVMERHPIDYVIGHSAGGMALAFLAQENDAWQPKKFVGLGVPTSLRYVFDLFTNYIGWSGRVRNAADSSFKKRFDIPIDDVHFESELFPFPGLLIHDIEDDVAPIAGVRKWAAHWEQAQLIETQGLGHSVQDEQVFKTIIQFLKTDV